MGKFKKETEELEKFIKFLKTTGRTRAIDNYERGPKCIHVYEDFTAIATENHKDTLNHLNRINRDYKGFREHALNCVGCQISLEALFLFKGFENLHLFPGKIQKILGWEWMYNDADNDQKKKIYIGKLPSPFSGNWSSKARLVYLTSAPLYEGIEEFKRRIQEPLELAGFSDFCVHSKRASAGKGISYFQADIHHRHNNLHTYISIRSRIKD